MSNESQPGDQKPQETPAKETDAPAVYTESQWREMQSKIRKEIQPLKDQVRKLEADNLALQVQNDELDTSSKVLTEKVASLNKEIGEGLPADAAEARAKYDKLRNDTIKWQAEVKKEIAKHDDLITEATNLKLEREADKLSGKFGIDRDVLLSLKDPVKMREYALDNFDPTKYAKPEPTPEPAPTPVSQPEPDKLPKPESPVSAGGLTDAEFVKQYAAGQSDDHARYREIRDKKS